MQSTNIDSVSFNFSEEDKKLFTNQQHEHWKNIEECYIKLKSRCIEKIELPQSGTHKEWIASRVALHTTPSIMRMLYLTEAFCEAAKSFNSVSCAALIKALTEIPLHFGYIVWVLDSTKDFEVIREKMRALAFGHIDSKIGLTTRSNVSQKELYERSDEMMKKFFKEHPSSINLFETMYKESNATGHHNYEARMLCGLQNGDTWSAKSRKEQFVF